MILKDLLRGIRVTETIGREETEISGVAIDSRKIAKGGLFVAMKGTQVDGHKFIPKAIELGAAAILCENLPDNLEEGVAYVVVPDTEDIVGEVATRFYGNPSEKLKLVGVTGTNGKTTIATLLYNMFRKLRHNLGCLSTVAHYTEE